MTKICIVHFNTPKLTECLIRSINKFTPDSCIYIFDNSDKEPFTYRQNNIIYIDNTKGQIIDFDKWIKSIPGSEKSAGAHNKWASAKHCYTIQKCIEIIDDSFILLDSDVLLKRDISTLVDETVLYAGECQPQAGRSKIIRVLPYCLYFNVDLLKKYNVTFFKKEYCHGLNRGSEGDNYDTGAWFYQATRDLPYKDVKYSDFVVHYGKGSWKNKKNGAETFLLNNRKLWEDETATDKKASNILIMPKYYSKKGLDASKYSPRIKHIYQKQRLHSFIYG